jgi:hypothetical protein
MCSSKGTFASASAAANRRNYGTVGLTVKEWLVVFARPHAARGWDRCSQYCGHQSMTQEQARSVFGRILPMVPPAR